MDTAKAKLIETAKWALSQLNLYYRDDFAGRPEAVAFRDAIQAAEAPRDAEQQQYYQLAQDNLTMEECEIDEDAVVSLSEDTDYESGHRGAYVQAWVWVDNPADPQ